MSLSQDGLTVSTSNDGVTLIGRASSVESVNATDVARRDSTLSLSLSDFSTADKTDERGPIQLVNSVVVNSPGYSVSSYPDMNKSLTEGERTELVWRDWVHEITEEDEDLPVYEYQDMLPLYNKVGTPSPKSATFTVGRDNTITNGTGGHVSPWSLTPNTAQFILDHLNANPPPSYDTFEGYVDPNLLQKDHTHGGDGHDDAAAVHEAAYGQAWDDVTMRVINDYFNNAASSVLERAGSPCADVKLKNDDMHSVPMMLSVDSDDESAAESDDEDEFTIHTEDVVRHVWRGVNIKYVVMHNGKRLFLTADQLDIRFFGVRSALRAYWKGKSAKRIPQAKLIGHLKRYGGRRILQRDALAPSAQCYPLPIDCTSKEEQVG